MFVVITTLKCRHLAYLSKGWRCSECVVCWVRDLCNTMFLCVFFLFFDCENVILSIKVNQNSLLWKLHALLHTGVLCKGLLSDSRRICGYYRLRFAPFSNSRFSVTAVLADLEGSWFAGQDNNYSGRGIFHYFLSYFASTTGVLISP